MPSSSFVSSITCVTWRNDSPAAKYCATNWNFLVLLTIMAYRLTFPESAASSEESRFGTKLARRRAQVILSMYSGWNIMSPIMTLTISLSISARKGRLWGPENTYILPLSQSCCQYWKTTSLRHCPAHNTRSIWSYASAYCAKSSSPLQNGALKYLTRSERLRFLLTTASSFPKTSQNRKTVVTTVVLAPALSSHIRRPNSISW